MKLGIATLAGAVGVDLIAHLLMAPALEQVAHVATVIAMAGTLLAIIGGSYESPATNAHPGDRHAAR